MSDPSDAAKGADQIIKQMTEQLAHATTVVKQRRLKREAHGRFHPALGDKPAVPGKSEAELDAEQLHDAEWQIGELISQLSQDVEAMKAARLTAEAAEVKEIQEAEPIAKNVEPEPVKQQLLAPSFDWRAVIFPALFVCAVVLVIVLVALQMASKPSVEINFDVGQIIGGSLAGIGALIAALAYAHGWPRGGTPQPPARAEGGSRRGGKPVIEGEPA